MQAGFDSGHSGFNRFETKLSSKNVGNLTQLWAAQVGVGGFLYASPVVCNGKVFIGGGDGRMYAFDAATGATLWVGPQQTAFFVDSAAAGNGLVFASSLYQKFLAYKADTGEIAWTSEITQVRASPTIDGQTVYVGSLDGTLFALDAETGTTKWSSTKGGCCVYDQAPVVDGGRVLQMRTNGTLTAYDAQSGERIWRKPEFSVGTQAAAYGMAFFNHYPNVVALNTATGKEVWTVPLVTGATTGAPAVANRRVFITQSTLMALDSATGALIWEAPAASSWGPSVANGVVYASSLNGEWDAFDARSGALLWSVTPANVCGGTCTNSTPVIANGILYLAGPDNYLRAYGLPR